MISARQIFLGRGGGAKLPYDAEVEWIQTGNGAWVDTGIKPVSSIVVQNRFMTMRDIGDTIFGYNRGNDNQDWRLFNAGQQIFFDWGLGRLVGGSNTLRNNTWYELELGDFYVKDIPTETILLSGASRAGDVLSDATLTFGRGNNSTGQARFSWCRIFLEGESVRDMKAVRFTNEQDFSEGAMYDRLSGQLFRNAGTGSLTIGPDRS